MKKGVLPVIVPSDLTRTKERLEGFVGQEIQLTLRRGRKRAVTRRGVLEKTYPSIFVVKLNSPKGLSAGGRRISYSYADMLTNAVSIEVCDDAASEAT